MNRPSPGLRPPLPRRAGRGQGEGRAVSRPAPTDVCGYSLPEARTARWIPSLVLLVLCAFNARAFVVELNSTGDPLRWHLDSLEPTVIPCPEGLGIHTNVVNPLTKGIRYFLASDAYSATNATAELNAVRASFAQWQAIAGTILKFEDAGLVAPGLDVNTCDDRNVVFWAKNSTFVNGGFDNISGALAVTFYSSFPENNELAEADIVFNGVQYLWSADFNSADTTKQFIESTATHEIGHFLGLKHSPVGGATMLFHGGGGVNVQAGLSSDEVSAAKWLYGQSSTLANLGQVQGSVTMNGSPVFGAVVIAEDFSSGNLIAGTVSRSNGVYDLPALPPAKYNLRVSPLDSTNATSFLVRGRDISIDTDDSGNYIYDAVQTAFLPTSNAVVTVTAGANVPQNFSVTSGNPAFRITRIGLITPAGGSPSPLPVAVRLGQGNYTVMVGSADLPTTGATLTVKGDGLTSGPPTTFSGGSLSFISVPLSVASNATPGLRSLVVQRGTDFAYANGFLKVQTMVPDFNFDGLDDRFQRQYFALFTASEAGPGVDPDGDGFNNQAEYLAGTNPTNALSLLKIEGVTLDTRGSTITWQSVTGKAYRIWSRRDVAKDPWQTVGSPVKAAGASMQFTDVSATNGFRFYRVQVLP